MKLTASAQYNDWTGTAAADDADNRGFRDLLREKGILQSGQHLVSLGIYVGENHGGRVQRPHVTAMLIEAKNYDEAAAKIEAGGPTTLKRVNLDMSLEDFFGLFKRFDIVISQTTLDINDREFLVIDEETS